MSYGDNGRMNKKNGPWIFCFLSLADFSIDFRIDQVESIVVFLKRQISYFKPSGNLGEARISRSSLIAQFKNLPLLSPQLGSFVL